MAFSRRLLSSDRLTEKNIAGLPEAYARKLTLRSRRKKEYLVTKFLGPFS